MNPFDRLLKTLNLTPAGVLGLTALAVLPFENLGPADDEYLADGITAELISRLSGLQNLAVISRTRPLVSLSWIHSEK